MLDTEKCPIFKDDTCIFHNCKFYDTNKTEFCQYDEMRAARLSKDKGNKVKGTEIGVKQA